MDTNNPSGGGSRNTLGLSSGEYPNFIYMIIDIGRDIPTLLVSPFGEDRMMASYTLAKETAKTAYAFLSREGIPASNDTLFPSKAMQLAIVEGLFNQGRLTEEEFKGRCEQIELSHKYKR